MTLDSFQLAKDNLIKAEDRVAKDMGLGSSKIATALIQRNIDKATQVVIEKLKTDTRPRFKSFIATISPLDPSVIALVALQGTLDAIANCYHMGRTYTCLGALISHEVYAFSLQSRDKKLAARLEVVARQRNSSLKYRKQAVRSMAAKAGFKPGAWKPSVKVIAGQWLVEVVLELRDVFVFVPVDHDNGVNAPFVDLTPEAISYSQTFIRRLLELHPVPLPLLRPPQAWQGLSLPITIKAGTYNVPLVRKEHCTVTQAELKKSLADGTLKPVLDSLSHIQATAWRINPVILETIQWAQEHEVKVKGLPPCRDITVGAKASLDAWEGMSEDQRRSYRKKRSGTVKKNRGFVGQREAYKRDVETAKILVENGNQFWTPVSMDYRGRVYPACHFSYQRQDYVRAMFEFSEGKPLGPDGFYWLSVHLATTGDFDKVSKKPFQTRLEWVSENYAKIIETACNPLSMVDWWSQADSPFMFLAACLEFEAAIRSGNPSNYVSHLPVGFDGSCSGLQHFAAMTRCEATAPLVNLVKADAVSDIYQTVADKVLEQALRDAQGGDKAEVAQKALDYGIDRKLVKRNVMTYSYSSKKFGMSKQIMVDTMAPLADQVTSGELEEHPFSVEGEDWAGQLASRYLGSTTYDCIEQTVSRPAEAMKFLQGIARALAHESKPTIWHTPMGFPVILRCPKEEETRVRLFLQDRGVTIITNTRLVEDLPGIDKARSANGIAPGFVHSYDACHLQMVVLEASHQGIHNFALVHDSFGCHAGDASRFRQVILNTFHRLYSENDVLGMIHEEAHAQIQTSSHMIPYPPSRGSYDINEVKHAAYAFA